MPCKTVLLLFVTFIVIVNAQDEKKRDDLISAIYGPGPGSTDNQTEMLEPRTNISALSRDPSCNCVFYYNCKNGTIDEYGKDILDIRKGANPCNQILMKCCDLPSNNSSMSGGKEESTPGPDATSTTGTITTEPTPPPKPKPNYCGIRNALGFDFRIKGHTNEAEYGEFPWMVAILKTNYVPTPNESLAICGGSLIAPRVVLTGAHCVHRFDKDDIKVRAGEWDTKNENEKDPYQERRVSEIIIHEGFRDGILHSNIALLILESPFKKARHIATICLPNQDEVVSSKECYTTGWGKEKFDQNNDYQSILKKIDLPTVPHDACQTALRETRLGEFFKLHESFVCAGGIPGKDACTGDGGGPLVCPDPNKPSRYVQVGIVSWGIGCGTETPGVYVNVPMFRNWVDDQMQRLKLSSDPYTV